MTCRKFFQMLFSLGCGLALGACSFIPGSGFLRDDAQPGPKLDGIQIVDVDDSVARQLLARRNMRLFSEVLSGAPDDGLIGTGDTLEVNIWEAPPSTLFGTGIIDPKLGPLTSRVTTLPEQMVSRDGTISVPFAGQIKAAGRTLPEIETDIA